MHTLFFVVILNTIYIGYSWDYLLFVQLWPSSWLKQDHNHNYNFTNSYFTLHGIWPEYWNNSWPQFCSNSTFFNLSIIKPIYDDLTLYWTDFKYPLNFWKHEYFKHMTCINETDLEYDYKYFWYGLAMREDINLFNSLYHNRIVPSNDYNYSVKNIRDTIKKIYGVYTVITCDHVGILEEIRFCMNKDLELFDCPENAINASCKNDLISYYVYN